MSSVDILRELQKICDVMSLAEKHFDYESKMNAALHMSPTVRLTPLGSAVATATESLQTLIDILIEKLVGDTFNDQELC